MDHETRRGIDTVAAYLVGRHVPPEALADACDVVSRQAAPGLAAWRNESGDGDHEESACEAVQAILPEYSEARTARRQREYPLVAEHLRSCADCRSLYRQLVPLWSDVALEVVEGARATVREMLVPMRLAVRRVQGTLLLDDESALLVEARRPALSTLAGDDPEATLRQEWAVAEPDQEGVFHFAWWGAPQAAQVNLEIRADLPERFAATEGELRVMSPGSELPLVAEPLDDKASCQVQVPAGTWQLELRVPDQQRLAVWRFVITLDLAQ